MRSNTLGGILVTSLLASAAGCGSEPGRFAFTVEWPSDDDAPAEVFLRSEVRLGDGTGAIQGQTVGPVAFGAPAELGIGRVPNGRGHVLVVEVAATAEAEVVLYFGQSEPFDVAPGLDVRVVAPLALNRPPSAGAGSSAVALVPAASQVSTPEVVLALTTDTGVIVEVSNRPGFVGRVETFDLSTATGASEACPPAPGQVPA